MPYAVSTVSPTKDSDRTLRWEIVAALSAIFCIRLVTLPLYPLLDKTEARYAQIAQLMLQSRNWITPLIEPGVPFLAKPVLSVWLTAISFQTFGINDFAARLPSFLILIATTWMVFSLGRSCRDAETGGVAACVFSSTALGFYFGGTVMTDPALLLGVTLAMYGFWSALAQPTAHRIYGYLLFIGMAVGVLAKGPIGFVLPGISIAAFVAYQRNWKQVWRKLPWFKGTALAVLLVVPWYVLAEMRSPGFLHYFIIGEHFERFVTPHWEGSLYEPGRPHAKGTIVLYFLIAALPWVAVFAISMLKGSRRGGWLNKQALSTPWTSFLLCWLFGAIALFFFASNILLSYAATSIPPFALLTAQALPSSLNRKKVIGLVVVSMLVPVLFLACVIAGRIEPYSPMLRSRYGIVSAFNAAAGGARNDLYYVVNKPYSADFYSHGRAKRLEHVDDVVKLMNDPTHYFAMAEDLYEQLPETVRSKLAIRADRNGFLLLSRDMND